MSTHAITRDADAAEMMRRHHAHLAADLEALAGFIGEARDETAFAEARASLLTWLQSELAPHATGEEATLYRAAAATNEGRLLVQSMIAEHRLLFDLVAELESAQQAAAASAWAGAILRVFRSHTDKENDLVLPLLVSDPTADLAFLLDNMHESL